ncbi:glycosyltransferase family 2 protein [bacterium]|nr:MAG: glycosyltransferase family 2 protein [bacterium]
MIRLWEIIPGALAWATLLGFVFLSWQLPAAVVVIVLLYDLYWFLKLIYLFFHLRSSFMKMRANLKLDWLIKLKSEKPGVWGKIRHLVIFPMLHESHEVVRESFLSLAQANYPKEKFFVVLATEENGGEDDQKTAAMIKEEFGGLFGNFLVTVHPAGRLNELPGKGSNEAWAGREAREKIIDPSGIPYEDILVSVFDIDTKTEPNYFGILTHTFLNSLHSQHSSYQPIPIYMNNIHEAPFFARLVGFSSTFWQLMQEARPEQLVTFSSHSMPWKALTEVGFWETDLVSEDSRIFFQCLVHYKGDWRAEPILYPVYMDAVTGKTLWSASKNLYKQQRRWAWGAENLSRLAGDFFVNKEIPGRVKRFWLWILFDGFYSWSTSSFIIFLFGWLPNILGNEAFRTSVLSYNLPRLTGWILNLSSVGILASAFLSIVILQPKMKGFKKRYYVFYLLQWVLTPFTFLVFSAIPALDAQTRLLLSGRFRLGFWKTPKAKNSLLIHG